jgi:hypothetical protein
MCEACVEHAERVMFVAEDKDREVAYALAWDQYTASGIKDEPHTRCETYNRRSGLWRVEFTAYSNAS